jgi:acetolactate synthase-1/2/3 large subunit
MILNGARIVVECLKEQRVDTVFGYPGGKVIPLYDALYDSTGEVRHILTAHEQGASHAADGYARVTGRVGVCIATSGPGSTNLITGIATAYMDSSPIVAITGNVGTPWLGRDSFQEVDIIGMTMSVTKHNYQVRRVEDLAGVIREAFHVAASGRPGPVLIDIPVDVFLAKCEYEPAAKLPPVTRRAPGSAAIEEALSLTAGSRRPMIYAGGGVVRSGATGELIAFAERLHAPVACSLMGLGGFPGDHPLFTGMVGMHGSKASNMGVTHCDLLLVAGARFSDRVVGILDGFAPGAQVLHMDIDPAEVGKNIPAVHAVIGDLKLTLDALSVRLPESRQPEWLRQIEAWRDEDRACVPENHVARTIMTRLRELSDEDAIIVTDVGQHQMWTAQYFTFGMGNDLVTSGGLGTMGFGLGAAIGAKIGCPDRQVIHIAGDGCFRMNLNEMVTAARYGIPVKTILMDNQSLGMVRQWQYMFHSKRLSQTVLTPVDFCRIAEGFGVRAWRLERMEDVEPVLREALAWDGPALVQCAIDPGAMVLPMVPPGQSIDNIIMKVVE